MKRVLILEVRRKFVCCFEDDFDVTKRQNVSRRVDQISPYTEQSCFHDGQYHRHFHLRHCVCWNLPLVRFLAEIQNALINEVWGITVFPKNFLQFFLPLGAFRLTTSLSCTLDEEEWI